MLKEISAKRENEKTHMYYQIVRRIYKKAAKKMCLDCQDFLKKGSKILDLGCGSAIAGKEFQSFFEAKLIGVDIKDQRIEKIPFQLFDGKCLPFSENSFDATLINFVLHHTKNPTSLLKEAKRVSKEKIIVFEDLPEGILSKLICKIHGITFNYFFQKNRENSNFKKSEEWKKIFDESGLKLIFEKRVSSVFNPVKKKLFILEKI